MKMKPITWEVNKNDCWICTSHKKDKDGYPVGYRRKIHRHVYEQCFREIPIGMVVMHKCDNPSCINPEHLKLGTYKENTQDMYQKKRNVSPWINRKNKKIDLRASRVIEKEHEE